MSDEECEKRCDKLLNDWNSAMERNDELHGKVEELTKELCRTKIELAGVHKDFEMKRASWKTKTTTWEAKEAIWEAKETIWLKQSDICKAAETMREVMDDMIEEREQKRARRGDP